MKLLDQLRTRLKRRDLINELREAADRYRKQAEEARSPEAVKNSTGSKPLPPAELNPSDAHRLDFEPVLAYALNMYKKGG